MIRAASIEAAGPVLGLDLGSARIGVAVAHGTIAVPYSLIRRGSAPVHDHEQIAALVTEVGAVGVVVGMPFGLDGKSGPAARAVAAEMVDLEKHVNVPVVMSDERFTTVIADAALRNAGSKRSRRRRSVDPSAATIILQGWLDQRLAVSQ